MPITSSEDQRRRGRLSDFLARLPFQTAAVALVALAGTLVASGQQSDVVPSPCPGVLSRWVDDDTYPNKIRLWIVNECPTDLSVRWFVGKGSGNLKAVHRFSTLKDTGFGVRRGDDNAVAFYICPMDHPVAVKLNGDRVDGPNERYVCAKGRPPSF